MPIDPQPPQRQPRGTDGPPLFDAGARDAAERQGPQAHFRWLALSDDPEAAALRAALEPCFALADRSRDALRKGLMHERWGQHVGALAHLLALGMFARQGFRVEVEPELGGQAPDILASRDAGADGRGAARLLVEVRAVSGAGTFPWEERRALQRSLAHDREKHAAVQDSVARIIARKAEVYRPLVARLALPYVICLYEDKDDEISALVRDIAFGGARGGGGSGAGSGGDDERDPDGGAFAQDSARFHSVSAVIVFGRLDTESGELLLRGELIVNPHATAPLPEADAFPLLRVYARAPALPPTPPQVPARMRWLGPPSTFSFADPAPD